MFFQTIETEYEPRLFGQEKFVFVGLPVTKIVGPTMHADSLGFRRMKHMANCADQVGTKTALPR